MRGFDVVRTTVLLLIAHSFWDRSWDRLVVETYYLLRGNIVNRGPAARTKTYIFPLFLLAIFGPATYGPP